MALTTAVQSSIDSAPRPSTEAHVDASTGSGVRVRRRGPIAARPTVLLFCLAVLVTALPGYVHAQTFKALPAMSFTKVYAGGDPPSQVITAASTGASFGFYASVTNSTGGNWLSISLGNGQYSTPHSITVSAHPDIALTAGTYSAQITLTSSNGQQAQVIPVSLVVAQPSAPSFDETAGAITFSLLTKGSAPPFQTVPIRNAGSGTLNWTASTSTADGGSWLTLSATSGIAPSALQVSINPANLPGAALSAGVFVGQVVLQTDGDRTTIPVTVTVGDSVFRQINPLSFTKAYQGSDPPSQVITAASTGASFGFYASVINSTGGNWLTASLGNGQYSTPRSIIVSANPAVTLAAGTYTAEIVLTAADGTQASVIPVSLTIAPATAAFFDQTNGELTFSLLTKGSAPPFQTVPIRNAGSGTLNWTASTSTADGGSWLTLSATSGIAPSALQVSINPANLPGAALSAGVFVGQVVLQTDGDRTTIPVTVTVGDSVFRQINPLSFTKAYQGSDPPSQVITAASTGASFGFYASVINSTGGNWLTASLGNGQYSTPRSIIVSANPAVTLAAGTYTAEIVLTAADGTQASVIPVSLTIAPATAAFFDQTNGELTFSLLTKGSAPPFQTVPIRNAGSGTLNWTASTSTADGGSWLTLSATSGIAPSALQVSINPANLPGAALSAGVFVGQVVLQTDGDRTTIPVTVTVGDSVFRQINPLSFTKAYQGSDPPSQVITAASTGASFGFYASVVNSTGGNWLTASLGNGQYSTPRSIIVSANPAVTLAAGTYTAEIVLTAADGTQASVVPVSLTIAPATTAFFDQTAGALTFSMQPSGTTPPSQAIPVRNAGSGTLNWTASASTADGGNWLSLSATSGTAPSALAVTVDPSQLPGQGFSSGTFTGQVVLQNGTGGSITVPVTFTLGTSVFSPLSALSFSKLYQGANPSTQMITAASTGASFGFYATVINSTGGNWLTTSLGNGQYYTPRAITVSASPATSLNPGTYTAEVILTASDGTQASVIPVFLTVGAIPLPAATPTFSPGTGTYTAAQTVTINDATPGATIYYTTNGSTPTTSSAQYSGAFAVNGNVTLKAVAISASTTLSSTGTATYTFTPATTNASSVGFGSQAINSSSAAQTVVIANPGANSLAGVSISLYGTNSADFALSSNTCDAGIAAGGTCSFAVSFTPQGAGGRSATVSIAYTGFGSPLSVGLSGTGSANLGALQFVPVVPCRIADTRNATGAFGGPIIPGGTAREFDIPQSACGIPANALAYSLNVTVVPPGPLGFLTLWPTGLAQPNSSTLNSDGRVKANAAITPAGDRGGVNVYVSSSTHVILDINGYFVAAGAASALAFYPVTPCRVADTRNATGALGGPFIAAQGSRSFPVQSSSCGIPSTAQAYSLNVTAVPRGNILNYLTSWPTGQTQPNVSTLNASTGAVTANAAIVPAGTAGSVSFYASDASDLVLDINGYFAPPASGGLSLYTANPCRVIDTRSSSGIFNGELTIPVATSACAPPSTAQAYVLNATVVPPGPIGYLSLWPDGQAQPQVSTLNANDGVITSNLAIVPVVNGKVDAYTSSPDQLILDISSYFAP